MLRFGCLSAKCNELSDHQHHGTVQYCIGYVICGAVSWQYLNGQPIIPMIGHYGVTLLETFCQRSLGSIPAICGCAP